MHKGKEKKKIPSTIEELAVAVAEGFDKLESRLVNVENTMSRLVNIENTMNMVFPKTFSDDKIEFLVDTLKNVEKRNCTVTLPVFSRNDSDNYNDLEELILYVTEKLKNNKFTAKERNKVVTRINELNSKKKPTSSSENITYAKFYCRKAYDELYNKITKSMNPAIIEGPTGNGKTIFLLYFLRRLLRNGVEV
jgi:primosomal protein N'